jgi:hypothetical protein
MRLPRFGRAVMVAGAVALVPAVAACGSDNSSSSVVTTVTTSATTATIASNAALCTARDNLKGSIQELTGVDVIKNGTSSLQAALTKVEDNLQAVKDAAGPDLQPQVTAVQNAVNELSTAVANVSSVGVAGVVTAARGVGSAGTTLLTSLDKLRCG